MARPNRRMLAVTHEASRTGAPMVLLRLLEWLHARGGVDIEVLALRGGPLLDQFARVGPVHLVDAHGTDTTVRRVELGMGRVGLDAPAERLRLARLRRATRELRGFDLLYVNSATSAVALRVLPEVPHSVVSHVHELDSAFNRWMDDADRRAMLAATSAFVVAADCVGDNLVRTHGVDPARVHRCYEFIDLPEPTNEGMAAARNAVGVGPDDLLVGAVGTADWRKGTDLFLQMAARVRRVAPDLAVRFAWVGKQYVHDAPHQRADLERLGLGDVATFVGEVADPASYVASFDLFCLTSREDPYPLVSLEAGALGVPVVTFDNGGMVELAAAGEGEPLLDCVDYLDVEAMADVVVARLRDKADRQRRGARLRDWVVAHHRSEVGAAEVGEVLQGLLARTAAPDADAERTTGGPISGPSVEAAP
ncbi:MAG: glycosyltransferase family 4 protein [Acidimicrobiia bacterium]|nr:glycosyltransferase family 4 protein [Acidimicrobiia bacterium]